MLATAGQVASKLAPTRGRREPLLHFIAIGALLFAAQRLFPASEPITFTETEIQQLAHDWQRDSGRAPSPAELAASLRMRADDEILLREALRLSLDERDGVARRRLLQNMRFAFPETNEGDAHLLRTAQRMGMSTRDTVVRGRLVELMRARAQSAATLSSAQIDDYVQRHAQRYGAPARYSFRQVYFAAGETGKATSALARLKAGGEVQGEPFLLGSEFTGLTTDEIERRFGADFSQVLARAQPGAWSEPIASSYGLHLVRVEQVEAAQLPQAAAARTRAAYAALAEQEHAALDQALAVWRTHYRLQLPDGMEALR